LKLVYIIFFLCLFFSFLQSASPINLTERIKELKYPVYYINQQPFISLRTLLKVIGAENSWGRIEDRIFFLYQNKRIAMRIGNKSVIVGEKYVDIEYPPIEKEGEVLLHLPSFEKILSEFEENVEEDEEKSLSREDYVILIDPGHGGIDSGAVGNFGLKEKDVNLDISLRLQHYLKKKLKKYPYIKIYLTRDKDVYLSLEDRVEKAKKLNADIFFCIHTNSSKYNRRYATGFETFYPREKEEVKVFYSYENSNRLKENSQKDTVVLQIIKEFDTTTTIDESKILAEIVQEKLSERLITPDRGAKPGNFYVLKYTPMVSILTEIGFICNPNIEMNLRDVEVRQAIAETLGNAIIEYLERKKVIPSYE